MTEVDYSPARLSALLSVLGLAAAVVAVGSLAVSGGAIAAAGVPILVFGVVRGSRRAVTVGAAAALAGVLLAGIVDAPALPLLVGTVATVLAWDLGEQSINVGEQLGREASTRRGELVHAAASTIVGVVTAGLGFGIYRLATGGQPLAALFLLLSAAIALSAALRD